MDYIHISYKDELFRLSGDGDAGLRFSSGKNNNDGMMKRYNKDNYDDKKTRDLNERKQRQKSKQKNKKKK